MNEEGSKSNLLLHQYLFCSLLDRRNKKYIYCPALAIDKYG
jgi:hypothetical protein